MACVLHDVLRSVCVSSDPNWVKDTYRLKYKEPFYKGGNVKERTPVGKDITVTSLWTAVYTTNLYTLSTLRRARASRLLAVCLSKTSHVYLSVCALFCSFHRGSVTAFCTSPPLTSPRA